MTALRILGFAALLAAIPFLTPAVAFPPPTKTPKAAEPTKPKERTTDEVVKLLAETVKCSYQDMDMKSALSDLSQQLGVKIKFDHAFVAQQPGEQEQLTVTLHSDGLPLRKALRKLTETYQLSFGVVGDTIWISTEEGIAARQLRQYIPMNCTEIPLTQVMAKLSRDYSVNLVIDGKAKKNKASDTPITLQLEEATLETVLRLTSEMASLKPVRIGGVIYITTEDRADKLKDGDTLVPVIPLVPERNGDQPVPGQPQPGIQLNLPGPLGAPNATPVPADPPPER